MASSNDCDLMQAVITCEGDLHDPEFHLKFGRFLRKLKSVLCPVDKQRKLRVRRVEPWNSVRVTFTLPREAAVRLRQLAQVGDEVLRELGVLSVQLEGDQVISLTIAGRFNEPQEIAFRTDPVGRTAPPQPPECGTVGGAGPAKLNAVATGTPLPSDGAQSKNVMEILTQAVGVLASVPSTASCPPPAHETPPSSVEAPKPLATPTVGFLSPNVVAPHHQPVPFVPPTPPSATHWPLTNTYPFASMVHAAQTAQGASHAPGGARLPLIPAARIRTSSPLTFSAPDATLTPPAPPRIVAPTGAPPKPVERNGLSNSLLVNLLQCEQKTLPIPPPGAPKSLAPPVVTDSSNLTLAASVTVVNVRTGVTIPNLSNLANGGSLTDAPPLSAPPALSAPSSPQFAKIDKKNMVHSTTVGHIKAKPASPAPSSPSAVALVAAPSVPTPKNLPFIPGGATVTAVTHLNPPQPSAPPILQTATSSTVAAPIGAPNTNLLDGMVCVNDTYMLPGRNNLSITVVSDRSRLGPLAVTTNSAGTGTSNVINTSNNRNTPPPTPLVVNTVPTSLYPSLQPAKSVESTGKSTSSPIRTDNELPEAPATTTPSGNEDLNFVPASAVSSEGISAIPAGGLTVVDTEKSSGGTERIKLRLRLEKNEPVMALTAFKVEKTCSGPVSFLRKGSGNLVNAVPATKMVSLPVVGGCNASTGPNSELRVPPLHISLKGRNATLLSPPGRSPTIVGGAISKEDNSEDESGKFASKRKLKSKDSSEPRKPFKRKRSLPLIESDPEEEEEPKGSLGEELRCMVVETSSEVPEINTKVPRLSLDSSKPGSSPEKVNCETPSLAPPDLKKARLASEVAPPTIPPHTESPLVVSSALTTPPVILTDKGSPEDKMQELQAPSDLESTKRTCTSGTSSTTSATLPLIARTVHLNHVKMKEEPLLKVSVLNNVQKQVHNSLLHRGLELTTPTELEKDDKVGGGVKEVKEMTQAPPTQTLEAAVCKDEPVNTQGEDSGIESMDALSEKSPNQGESPSRREERSEQEILATSHSHSHAYVELPHHPNHLPSPPVVSTEEMATPDLAKKPESKILLEEEELEEVTTPSKGDHVSPEAKTEVLVNGMSRNSGTSSASTSPCREEEGTKLATPPEVKLEEICIPSPQEACLEEKCDPKEVLDSQLKEEVPVVVVEAVESTVVPEEAVVTSPPSPASPSSRKRRRSTSASPVHVPCTLTTCESIGILKDMEEEQKVETRVETPPPLEAKYSADEPVEMEVSEEVPESAGKIGHILEEKLPEATFLEETSPSRVPPLSPPTPSEEKTPCSASRVVLLPDSSIPPTLPEPILVPVTVASPVTTTTLVTPLCSTELSDSLLPSPSTVVTPTSPSVTVSVPAPLSVELVVDPRPPSVESSHSSPGAHSPAPVIPSTAPLPPSPCSPSTVVASPLPAEITPTLEPAPSLPENVETMAEVVEAPEISDGKVNGGDEQEMVVERPPSVTSDVTERSEKQETTETSLESGSSQVLSPAVAVVVIEEPLATEESVETVTEATPPSPKVAEDNLATEADISVTKEATFVREESTKNTINDEETEHKEEKGVEPVKTEPLEEASVLESEIVTETLTKSEVEIKEELPVSLEVSPPEDLPLSDPTSAPELVTSYVTEVNEVKEHLNEERGVRTEAPPHCEPLVSNASEEAELSSVSVVSETVVPSKECVNVPIMEEKEVTVDRTSEARPSIERTVTPTPEGVPLGEESRLEKESESPTQDKEGELDEEGEELGGPELGLSSEEGGGVGGSVSASGPNSPFHGFCDKEVLVPPVVEVEGVVIGGDTPPSVEPNESLLLSGANTASEESLEATTVTSVTKMEAETQEAPKLVTEQLRIEIPDVVTRCTRSGTRVISPDANARTDRRSPRQASPIVLSAGAGVEEKFSKRGVRRKRQESESSNASQGRNTPDAEDLSVTSRPSKRKCSENATELIKACMGLEDTPKRVVIGTTTTTNTTTTAEQTPPPPNNSVKRNSKGGLEEDPVPKLTGVNSEEEDNHLSDDEPLSELAHRAVRQALKDRTTRIRGSNVKRGGAKTFKERGAGGRRNSTDSPSGLNNSRSVTPTRRSGRALVGIKVATPTVLGAEATDLPTRRKTRSSCVTVTDGDGSQPANRRRPVSKDRR